MQHKGVGSVQALIAGFLDRNAEKPVISHRKEYRTETITGSELRSKICGLQGLLFKEKIKKGDTILLLGSNSINWIAVYFACILSGVIVVPLDVFTDKTLLKKIQNQVKAKALFQDKGLVTVSMQRFYLDELEFAPGREIPKVSIKDEDILEIIYTSGTTGDPKGVILTHGNILAGVNASVKSIPLKLRQRILQQVPLSHILGQVPGLFMLLYFGHHLFFVDTLLPKMITSFIRNKKINGVLLVPGILSAITKSLKGKSVGLELGLQFRLIGVGGASLDPAMERWWKRRLVIVLQGYGLTETSAILAANPLFRTKTGSLGRIVDGVTLKLGKGNEILVKGKNVTQGYYKNKEKTKESFVGGWFKTGDIGEIKNGYLYLKGRQKDIIITGSGLNVYPSDIEQELNRLKEVKESCVVELKGKIHAVVVLSEKSAASTVVESANKNLLPSQQIQSHSVWSGKELPKTQTGKVRKFLVLQEIGSEKSPKIRYESKLFEILDEVVKPAGKITSTSNLSALGMDSLNRVEFVSAVEQEFGIELEESKIDQHTKVRDVERLLKEGRVYRSKFMRWPLSGISRLVRSVVQNVLFFPLLRIFTKTTYVGLENICKAPAIYVCNHQSALDPVPFVRKVPKVAIAAASDFVFGIGTQGSTAERIFRRCTGVLSAFVLNAYPFGESIGTRTSLEFSGELLDRGYSILIFAEGHRTKDGKINSFATGVGYLAVRMGVPVIPVRIDGMFKVLPQTTLIPSFGKTTLSIGKPITFTSQSYLSVTKLIEKKVKEL